jgi:hypothetical protein
MGIRDSMSAGMGMGRDSTGVGIGRDSTVEGMGRDPEKVVAKIRDVFRRYGVRRENAMKNVGKVQHACRYYKVVSGRRY